MSIPGLTPMPVPAVPAGGYTSLARASHQYGDILPPPPNPPMFGNSNSLTNNIHHNMNSAYTPHNPRTYNTDNSYNPSIYNRRPMGVGQPSPIQPLMPPPPMPPTVGSIDSSEGNNDFDSTWDMNMSWTNPLDSSSASTSSYGHTPIETPHSPPHFDTDPNSTTLEYSEHDESLAAAEDVDHRQLILPAFGIGTKLGLSKGKKQNLLFE